MSDVPAYRRKVRFSDTDCQGHVFNANYFVYFDDAITDFLEASGTPCPSIEARGHTLVLARAECDFRSAAVLGEVLRTRVTTERIGNTSVTFGLRIEEEGSGRLVAEGREVYVVLDRQTNRPCPVPAYLREALDPAGAAG